MIILEENFGFSQCPSVHFQSNKQKSARVPVRYNSLIKGISEKAISFKEVGECNAVTEAMLPDSNGFKHSSVAKLFNNLASFEALWGSDVVGFYTSHELRGSRNHFL